MVLPPPENEDIAAFPLRPLDGLMQGFSLPKAIVKSYLDEGELVLIFGESGSLKSFIAFDLAFALANLDEWQGKFKVQGCLVIIIAGEGRTGILKRFMGLYKHHEEDPKGRPLFMSDGAAAFFDEFNSMKVSNSLNEIVKQHPDLQVVVIVDTVARNFGPGNESFTSDMGVFIANIGKHLQQRFNATVLLIHHSGHFDQDRARGSSALHAAVDREYKISKDTSGTVRMECKKTKDSDSPEPLSFNPKTIELDQVDEDGEPLTTLVLELTNWTPPQKKHGLGTNQAQAMTILRQLYETAKANLSKSNLDPMSAIVTVDVWKDEAFEAGMYKNLKEPRKGFHKMKDTLMERGVITIENDIVRVSGD